jgi:hypothetical protein
MKFRQGWLQWMEPKSADAAANTNTTATYFGHAPCDTEVVEVKITPRGSLTAHSSNYATIKVLQGTTEIATLDTDTTDWAAGTVVALTLTSTTADRDVAEDECVNYTITKAGTGVAVPACQIVVTARPQRKLP